MTSSGTGYYGAEYDRYLDRYDDSPFNRIKQHYWTAKQAVRSKFGKKEDEHLVSSDSELDAKLATFYSTKSTCENMLRCIERYQDYICELSQEENALGRFLKQTGKTDKTQAGKMMAAVGRAQGFAAQQRLALRVPLVRLHQELEVFTERAVADCYTTVEATERARTEYRGSLLWMKNVSEQLDPDTYRQMEKFRKVQAAVRRNKAKFDKLKLDCLQKVDLLTASRCNLFSQLMANYQNCLLNFWDRTSKAHSAVSENFKGYQHYDFVVLKDLAEPSRRLAELTAGMTPSDEQDAAEGAEASNSDDQLILLADDSQSADSGALMRTDSMEKLLFLDSPEKENHPQQPSALADLIEAPVPKLPPPPGWTPAAGSAAALADLQLDDKTEPDMLTELMESAPTDRDTFAYQWQHTFGTAQPEAKDGEQTLQPTQESPLHLGKGFLPSQLLDNANKPSVNQGSAQTSEKSKGNDKSNWYNLFADLDPLKNVSDDTNPC